MTEDQSVYDDQHALHAKVAELTARLDVLEGQRVIDSPSLVERVNDLTAKLAALEAGQDELSDQVEKVALRQDLHESPVALRIAEALEQVNGNLIDIESSIGRLGVTLLEGKL